MICFSMRMRMFARESDLRTRVSAHVGLDKCGAYTSSFGLDLLRQARRHEPTSSPVSQ